MLRIAIDMDEVIADFLPKHLAVYNRDYDERLTPEDLVGTKLRFLRPERENAITEYLRDPSFFRDLAPTPHSRDVVRELSERFEVFIATAAMEFPSSFTAKYEWLREHFDFLDDDHYVFCGDKSIIHADFLIDDNPKHFKRFSGRALLFDAPHNRHETAYTRVNDWLHVREYFQHYI